MTDDATPSAPTVESMPAPEPTPSVESAPSPAEPSPIVEQTAATETELASVIPEEPPSAPEPGLEPPEVEASISEPKPATQSAPSSLPQASTTQFQSVPSAKWNATDRARAVAKHIGKKETRLVRVVVLAKNKGRVTNDDMEKLLHVSDATASRYGTILVKRGLLKREGKGRGASYVLRAA